MPSIDYSSPLVETMFRSGLILEAELATNMMALLGADPYCAFVEEDRPGNSRGDTVTLRFTRPSGDDPQDRATDPVGNETTTSYEEDSVSLRYGYHSGWVQNVASDQNLVSFDIYQGEISRMAIDWAYTFEKAFLNQLTGNTMVNGVTDFQASGSNTVRATDAAHQYLVGGAANYAALAADPTAVLSTRVISELLKRATDPAYVAHPIAPSMTALGDLYVFSVSPDGFQQIKENSPSSDLYDVSKARLQGGESPADNFLLTGNAAIFDKTLILSSAFLPQGTDDGTNPVANTKKAAFYGARACNVVWGEGFTSGDHLGLSNFKQHRRVSVITDSVYGINRTVVPNESAADENWAAFEVGHYAPV